MKTDTKGNDAGEVNPMYEKIYIAIRNCFPPKMRNKIEINYAARAVNKLLSSPSTEGFAKEQLSEEKVLEILNRELSIYQKDYVRSEITCIEEAAKQICQLSIPQPTQQVSKELIKEIIIEYEAYRNVCKENAEVPLGLFEWLDGQPFPLPYPQQPEGAKEEAKYQNYCDCDNEMVCTKNCPARNQE